MANKCWATFIYELFNLIFCKAPKQMAIVSITSRLTLAIVRMARGELSDVRAVGEGALE
jgi:hypothetical protein